MTRKRRVYHGGSSSPENMCDGIDMETGATEGFYAPTNPVLKWQIIGGIFSLSPESRSQDPNLL